jgi:hypothetical protein
MDHKKEGEWCMSVVNVKANGLAMEGFQRLREPVNVRYKEEIFSSLVAVIKQYKGKETETHIIMKMNEEVESIK